MLRRTTLSWLPSVRFFRSTFKNPYLTETYKLTEQEREQQANLPVWDRKFDQRKYLDHTGEIKPATGWAFLDVEPYPRLKLMKLYYICLQEAKKLPDACSEWSRQSHRSTKYRMQIVDQNTDVREIEKKIGGGIAELLIDAAHDQYKLLKLLQKFRDWESDYDYVEDPNEERDFHNLGEQLFNPEESYKHDRNPRPTRPPTSNIHQN